MTRQFFCKLMKTTGIVNGYIRFLFFMSYQIQYHLHPCLLAARNLRSAAGFPSGITFT